MIVAILGAGPAGMSCANACLSFGLTPVVIERNPQPGGAQRANFHPHLWLLGAPEESGADMTRRLAGHFAALNVTTYTGARVEAVTPSSSGFDLVLHTDTGPAKLTAQALVLAMGTRPRSTPELDALAAASPRVIVGPLNDVIRDDIRNARVLILGGGDNALDHALFLAERGNRVRVCTRGRFSGRESLMEACRGRDEIELRGDCRPDALAADAGGVTARWGDQAERFEWMLGMYGYRPNTDLVARMAEELQPHLDARDYVTADAWQRTTTPGIYAAGDVIDNVQPSVATAIAQGLAAAKAIERDWKSDRLTNSPL